MRESTTPNFRIVARFSTVPSRLKRHGLVETNVKERVARFNRDGVGELKRRVINFAAGLADNVVRATDITHGINAADLPLAFLGAAVIVAENLLESERVAAPPPATFCGKTLAAPSGGVTKTPEECVSPEKNCSGRKRGSAAAVSSAELMSSAASKCASGRRPRLQPPPPIATARRVHDTLRRASLTGQAPRLRHHSSR